MCRWNVSWLSWRMLRVWISSFSNFNARNSPKLTLAQFSLQLVVINLLTRILKKTKKAANLRWCETIAHTKGDAKIKMRTRNSIWTGWVSWESFDVCARKSAVAENEYRWTCQRIRFWWFTFSFSGSAINTNLRIFSLVCRKGRNERIILWMTVNIGDH